MKVDPKDGRCRSCGGALKITDTDDATMTVECTVCGDEYQVEPDAFGDGAQDYYVDAHCERLKEASPQAATPVEFLAQLRLGEPVPIAPWEGHEELLPRVAHAEPGKILEIDEETYFYFLEVLPPRFQRRGEFCFAEGSGPFHLFWKASGKFFARALSEEETDAFCRLARLSRTL